MYSNKVAPYGSWQSQIDSTLIIGGNCKNILELQVDLQKGLIFWVEQTFPTGKRVLFEEACNDKTQHVRWSPDEVNVANSVHEYGGGSFCVSEGRVIVCHNGGISELVEPKAEPKPIFKNRSGQDIRHADPFIAGKHVYAVQERHDGSGEPKNCLIRVNIDTLQLELVAEGADFYAEPRVSLNGRWLAWIQWNKPYMPWDITSLYLMELFPDGKMNFDSAKQLLSGHSYCGVQWFGDLLYVIGDPSGFWNVFSLDPDEGFTPRNLYSVDKEIGNALWQFVDDRVYTISGNAFVFTMDEGLYVKLIGSEEKPKEIPGHGFSVFSRFCNANGKVYAIAGGPERSPSVIEVDLKTYQMRVIRETRSLDELKQLPISSPSLKEFNSGGVKVQGFFYPPKSLEYVAPEGTLPPVLLIAHGGPTGRTTNLLDMKVQYFTSRGWAVFDVNYRGSTGRGRAFRDLLLGQWGIADRDDMVNGAQFLIDARLVDAKKVCIMGGSAGGYLALSTLFHPQNPFAAAVSLYGVADLENLQKTTHKFEADYNVRLVAPYPEGAAIYRERSALYNLDKMQTPVAFIHGIDDPVVPCDESKTCYNALKAKGVSTSLKLFPGEGHGFKTAEAVTQSLSLSYYFLCQITGINPSVKCEMHIDNFDQN